MALLDLWSSDDTRAWNHALSQYDDVVAQQAVKALEELDRWYRQEFPPLLAARSPRHATVDELSKLTQWKMARGVWRARNLALVKSNPADLVVEITTRGLAAIPHPSEPIRKISELAGVGPATASAVAAAAEPAVYPFFDELVAQQVPELPEVAFTPAIYAKYADAIRARAKSLGSGWTPVKVECALWSNSGGKARLKRALPP